MKIWLICQYYAPERGTAQLRMTSLAGLWRSLGKDLNVLTATPQTFQGEPYPGYEHKPAFFTEEIDGVSVWRHRVKNLGHGKPGQHSLRLWGQLAFAWSLLRHWFGQEREPHVIVASSPPLLMGFSAWLLAKRYRAKFVLDIRALWPAVLVQIGLMHPHSWQFRVFRHLEHFLYRRADVIVVNSRSIAQHLVDHGLDPKKLYVLPDGVSDAAIGYRHDPATQVAAQQLRQQLQANPLAKIVLYEGPLGHAQAVGQVLDAARQLMGRSDVLFVIMGDGDDKTRLQQVAQGMPNVVFLSTPTETERYAAYTLANILLSCHKDVQGLHTQVPPRLLELLAAGAPVVGALAGEGADIMRRGQCGLVVPPEDSSALARAIVYVLDTPDKAAELSQAGPDYINKNYRMTLIGQQYLALIHQVVEHP